MNTKQHQTATLSSLGAAFSDLAVKNSIFANQIISSDPQMNNGSISQTLNTQIHTFNDISSRQFNLHNFNEPVSTLIQTARDATLSLFTITDSRNIAQMSGSLFAHTTWLEQTATVGHCLADGGYAVTDISAAPLYNSPILNLNIDRSALAQFSIQSNVARISGLSFFAEDSIFKAEAAGVGRIIDIDYDTKLRIDNSAINLSNGYAKLFSSFGQNLNTFTDFNPHIAHLTSQEYFNNANLIEILSTDEKESDEEQIIKKDIITINERSLSTYLPVIDADLTALWEGSKEALRSDNPDKVRHFGTSLRELFTQVIQSLAPTAEIEAWTQEEKYFHKGRPTRNARLHYICRNINNETFKIFIEKDIDALIAFLDLFQECTHSVKSKMTEKQLFAMQSRAESAVVYLISIGKS